ncbi:MAG: MBL fold metallo-hydrolase [Bacteroidetes bacterium]|nr:MAG: MBL fold metallo-hydrolase [Bacteroidota bacterium]
MNINNIKWLGHASFLIQNNDKNYYIDPFELKNNPVPADIIFVTHAHYDHWSPDDIQEILTPKTKIVCVRGCVGIDIGNRMIITKPFEEFDVDGVKVKTIPAYNTDPAKQQFHSRSNDWVGYVLEIGGMKIYHAGDTDFIPEMKGLNVDIALLPMGGTYTMNPNDMICAANSINAKVIVPMHYKRLLGNKSNEAEQKLKSSVNGEVKILEEAQF